MPCKIQIKQNITQKVEEKTEDLFGKPLDVAQKGARIVNSEYGYNVVRFYKVDSDYIDRQITIPSELVDIYYENELRIEEEESRQSQIEDARRAGEDYSDEYMFQTRNIFSAANEIQNKLKSLNKTINSMGSEKNIDEVLKKAGLEADLRNQFIKLVNENPSLKSLKVSEVLSSYLREFVKDSDRQYYKAIDEPLSNELENILIDYFDKFKIRRQELDNLKEKFGVDSVGVFDVLAKTIYYAKNRNLLTLPEEYGHVFVELLGSISGKKADNSLFKYMFDNIDKWDGYQRVLRDYKDVYITKEGNMDIYKIKKEAIGQAIGIALVRNYKVQKGDKDFWAKVQEAIDYILNLIKGIDYVSLNTTVDSIAKDILNKNYDKLDRMKKDTSNYNLLSYSETIKNQNKIDGGKALKFMQWFSQKGMLITGSLAYRLQGTTYRPEIDALHDIDNIVPSDIHKVSLNKEDYLTPEQLESSRLYYKYVSEGNYREAKKYKLQGNIRLNIDEIVDNVEVLQDFKKQFPETDFLYSFYNEKANAFYITINAIWSENKELKERFKFYTGSFNQRLENFTKEELEQIYLFDFFLRPESSEEYKKIEDPEFGLTLAHFNYAFYEKLNMMGRAKDAYDYQMWDYYNDESILAPDFNDRLVYFQIQKSQEEKPQPTQEVKPGVENKPSVSLQTEDMPMSTASEETIEKLKQIADKANINLQTLDEYLKGNPEVNAKGVNALADTLRKIIAIAEGKEGVSITEELVHIATAMIEQADPKLITQMISKIDKFKIYKKVLDTYGKRKEYQLPNGKPDIRKIKKEAVDKLIAELIIKKLQGSNEFPELLEEETREMVSGFWQKILDFFRKIFRTSNIEIFELSADKIIKGDFAGITSEIINGEVYFQLSNAQKEFQQRVAADKDNIRKVEGDKKSVDPLLMDTEEASNFYEVKLPDGTFKRVLKRVTDRVHRWYEAKFGKNKEFTEAEKKFNNLKREHGIKYHHFFEDIYSRYFTPDGTKRDRLDPRTLKVSGVEQEIYNILENYFVELIKSHSKNGKTPLVFSELKVYDPKEGEAGTLDLVIVDEDGKASIYDWKFMTIAESSNDVPWYKQGAFNIQLTRYREILRDVYGIKEFDKVRAIPILMDFKPKLKYVKGSDLEVSGIHIGSVDTSKITDLRLVPVLQEEETTGIAQLDKLISQLNSIYNQISKKEASTEEEKEFKRERLNMLRQAVRRAQGTTDVSGIIDVIKLMRLESDQLINDWETIYSKKPAASKDFENEELSDYAENLREFIVISDIFANIDKAIGSLIYNDSMVDAAKTKQQKEELKYRKQILDDIQSEASRINDSKEEIKEIAGKFADKFMGERNLVKGLLNPQAVWKNIASWFRGVSESPLKSVQILYKMVTNARDTASLDANKMIDELLQIRKAIVNKGGNTRDYIKKIYQKDKEGGIVNKLIYKFDKKFYELVDDNAVEGKRDKNWLLKNIDVEAYKKEALDILNNKIKYYTKLYSENETLRDELILKERRKWDISRSDFTGWNNYVIKRHPKEELWLSNEYKEVKKDPELLRLYNFILSVNDIAGETGYIQNRIHATFLPYVRKTMAESLAWDFSLSSVMKFSDDLKIRTDEVGYGSINELTKELEYGIPKYYTYDFTKNYKEDGTVEYDYSDVSEDLFKNMILYVNHLHKYKYLSEIEEQLKLVKTIETFKDHYRTTTLGNVVIENGKPVEERGNEENVAIFDKFLRALLYEQKYPIDSGDVAMNFSVRNGIKKAINAVAKKEVYQIEEQPDAKSLVKTMDTVNRAFQLKTLGFEFISGAVNLFGANIQISTQAGNYFKAREVLKKEKDLLANRFKSDDEREMFRQLIDVFVPFKDDPSYDKLKEAGLSELTKRNFSDMLMFFMRVPEQHVEKSIFATLLDNVMVVDGNLVSIREYVNDKYKQRYSSGSEFVSSKQKIEEEIEELKKTKSISATKKLENGKLVIPGFDLNNRDEVRRLSVLTRRLSRNATGGMSDADINRMQMNVFTRSMMVFKNWIPKLVDTRFSEFRKTSDDFSVRINEDGLIEGEKYDIGRARLFFSFMQLNFVKSLKDMMDVMSVNDRGLEILDKLYLEYAAKYKEKTGEDLTMSREDFNDLIRTNLRNQFKEFAIAIALTASYMALGYLAPDDDDDKAKKNAFRFAQRTLDKFVSELMFFYNPVEFENILSGNMFPAIGLFADITRFFNHFMAEVTGMDFSDATDTSEEVREKAQPVKNLAKTLPLAKSLLTWGAILDADFAKEYDITIQKETNR